MSACHFLANENGGENESKRKGEQMREKRSFMQLCATITGCGCVIQSSHFLRQFENSSQF
jgi:hypothetical protein